MSLQHQRNHAHSDPCATTLPGPRSRELMVDQITEDMTNGVSKLFA